MSQTRNSPFPSTRASLILEAQGADPDRAFAALSTLCETYWQPLYVYVRRWGNSPEKAQDLTQGYLAEFLERGSIKNVDQCKGRLRSYLLKGLKFHISQEHRKETASKRGGKIQFVSIDQEFFEKDYHSSIMDQETPETLFERQWATTVLNTVLKKLELVYENKGKIRTFQAIKPFLSWNTGEGTYTAVASDLDISEGNVKTLVFRMRQLYRILLEQEVGDTVEDPNDIQVEIDYLAAVLARG